MARTPVEKMLFRALVELGYVQYVGTYEGLTRSAEGDSIVEQGMKMLGVTTLADDDPRNADLLPTLKECAGIYEQAGKERG